MSFFSKLKVIACFVAGWSGRRGLPLVISTSEPDPSTATGQPIPAVSFYLTGLFWADSH